LIRSKLKKKIFEVLKRVRGVTIAGVSLTFDDKVSLSEVLNALNDVGVVIAFDEAQYFRYYGSRGGKDFLAMVSYAYDNLENVRFIFSGSEVGLLRDFLGIVDYDSPLYGRIYEEIMIEPFTRELSKNFLRRGFEEFGIDFEEEVIEKAVELLNGIPGWLVEFGYNYVETRDFNRAMENVVVKAERFLEGELRELSKRSRRYILILKAIAMGLNRWELVKGYVESRSGKIPNTRLANLLRNLEKMGWIRKTMKEYRVVDPVIVRVLKNLSKTI